MIRVVECNALTCSMHSESTGCVCGLSTCGPPASVRTQCTFRKRPSRRTGSPPSSFVLTHSDRLITSRIRRDPLPACDPGACSPFARTAFRVILCRVIHKRRPTTLTASDVTGSDKPRESRRPHVRLDCSVAFTSACRPCADRYVPAPLASTPDTRAHRRPTSARTWPDRRSVTPIQRCRYPSRAPCARTLRQTNA
jgi:hypothetical protein